MTDLMYLSSTTSICHIGETDVKTTANKMYFNHSTAICCIQHLVVKSTSWNKVQQKVVAITAKIFAVQQGS